MTISQFSRRDFLKLSASGVLGLVLSELGMDRALAASPASQGRAIRSGVQIYDAPYLTANKIFLFSSMKSWNYWAKCR